MELHREAKHEAGVAAECLLAVLKVQPSNDERDARAYTGALLLLDALRELQTVRKALVAIVKALGG